MEQKLKERLVGASVIIAIGVVVIPMLLDGSGERQLKNIPPAPEQSVESRPGFIQPESLPIPAPELAEVVSPSSTTGKANTPPAKVETASKSSGGSGTPPASKPEEKTAEPAVSTEAPSTPDLNPPAIVEEKLQAWVVQVGSFTDEAKAQGLRDELRNSSYKAFLEKIQGRSGQPMYRVRVGPVLEKAEAEALLARLKKQGKKGFVTHHP